MKIKKSQFLRICPMNELLPGDLAVFLNDGIYKGKLVWRSGETRPCVHVYDLSDTKPGNGSWWDEQCKAMVGVLPKFPTELEVEDD